MKLSIEKIKSVNERPYKKPRRCLNCGSEILHEPTDIYSRRFCSEACKRDYFDRNR